MIRLPTRYVLGMVFSEINMALAHEHILRALGTVLPKMSSGLISSSESGLKNAKSVLPRAHALMASFKATVRASGESFGSCQT